MSRIRSKNSKTADKIKKTDKPYWKMNADELAKATREFDRPIGLDETRPLTAAERRFWERARKPGRPRIGKGAVRVPFSMEFGLLEELDAFARARGMTRSALIAAAVRAYMDKATKPKAAGPAASRRAG